ncbi:T9SS sorting signal type C domain-containing protein [Sphingobacterium siyangense]|nr:T9SS sorting signal type C domain-containing protein [Sphingobacterium siyangense]QRY55503.1 T9SS type A sorting domain-containing protein [Sphingobacterium siyangense]
MKKLQFLLPLLLLSIVTQAQLYVSTNSYMYVKDQVVFVKQDINLQNNGNMYMRNESQLLQGTTSVSANKGLGKVSVFQEGTADNFDYNYWCSPVGNASAATGNENFGISMIHQPATATASTQATILPSSNSNGTASPLAISSRWIYKFLSSTSYSQWIYVGGASTLAPGQGFSMKGTAGTDPTIVEANGIQNNPGGSGSQRYDFRGKPNDGNILVIVAANNLTLTGNPYPSALNVNAFLLDATNNAATGIAYYWEQDKTVNSHNVGLYKGGYGAYSPISLGSNGVYVPATFNSYNSDGSLNGVGTSSGLIIERKYAPIGQGFMIKGASSGTVTLKNAHRAYYKESGALSQFERSQEPAPKKLAETTESESTVITEAQFKLNIILDNQFTRQIALVFLPEATDGIDVGIDALSIAPDDLPNDAYFFLDNSKYVIQGTNFDINKRIPLGVKAANNASIKFYVPEVANFDPTQMIYLYDGADDSYHDIKNGSYEVTLPTGIYNSRFQITFVNTALGVGETIKHNFGITQDNASQTFTVQNPNLANLKSVVLFDITGKSIFKKDNLGTSEKYSFSTSGLSKGVYIVDLVTSDNQKFSQKIIVNNQAN